MNRRRNGEGHFYRRGRKWYCRFRVSVPGEDRRKRIIVHAETLKECRERADESRKNFLAGSDADLTMGEWLAHWVSAYVSKLRFNTRAAYGSVVRNHLVPHLGSLRLCDLRPGHVARMLTTIGADHAPSTLLHIKRVLSRSLRQALVNGIMWRSIMGGVPSIRVDRSPRRVFTREEISKFIEAAPSARFGLAYLLLIGTGLRLGEALALRWSEVSLERATITVLETIVRAKGGIVTNPTKTALSKRTITLPDWLVKALSRTYAHRRRGLVVKGRRGRHVDPKMLRTDFHEWMNQVGLPRITIHGLRHIHASWLILNGVDLFEVSRRLGHSTIKTTSDLYGHLVSGSTGRAAEALSSSAFALKAPSRGGRLRSPG